MSTSAEFRDVGGHQMSVPARVSGTLEAEFLLDTGIGLTVVSTPWLERMGGRRTERTFTGKRMSGESLVLPMGEVAAIRVAERTFEQVPVGLWDLHAISPELAAFAGILSLPFFGGAPVTLDHQTHTLTIEDPESLAHRAREARAVPVEVEEEGPSQTLFMRLALPTGREVRVEVDTGSYDLILHPRFMDELGVSVDGPGVRRVEGTDESGHRHLRHHARLSGSISPSGVPEVRQVDPPVIFQEIIYDGLIGTAFLERQPVTYDPASSRILLGYPP